MAASLPPGPRLPGWLQTLAFAVVPEQFIGACRRRYGDVVTFNRLIGPRFVMVLDAAMARQVFHARPGELSGGTANASLRPLVGEHSLLVLDGAEHSRQRELLLPSFSGERMRSHEAAMREAADRVIDSWPVGRPFALMPSLGGLTLDVILHVLFGRLESHREAELRQRVEELVEYAVPRVSAAALLLFGGATRRRRFEERRRRLDDLVYETIARRRAEPDLEDRHDVLSRLLFDTDEVGVATDDARVRDQVVTLLFAGYKSTQTALAWAFEFLLRHPSVLGRVSRELARGDEACLDAVVSETLRLRPAAMSASRMVGEDPYELDGHMIPPATEINVSIAELHRQPHCFPEPGDFRPERFLDPGVDTRGWVPFGAGGRRCVGASFATFEMGVVIRRVFERTSLVPSGRRPEKHARIGMTARNASSFVPKRGVRVVQGQPPKPVVAEAFAEVAESPR